MTAVPRSAVALLWCGLLGACAGSGPADVTAEGPLLVSTGSSDEGMAAEIRGALSSEKGCLSVGGYPAIWPEGTAWDSERQVLTLLDGVDVALGDEVYGGGGYLHPEHESLDEYAADVAELLRSCLGPSGEVAMFNRGHSIEKRG